MGSRRTRGARGSGRRDSRRCVNGTPPIRRSSLLRAAHADALPPDLQAAVSEHLSASALSRTLADGLGEDGPTLTAEEQERLLARIMKEAGKTSETSRVWNWFRPALVGAGLVAVASLVWLVSSTTERGERIAPPETTVVVALPPAAPPFLLPFEKPDVRLGMDALTWRGTTGSSNPLLADLKPGLDAYRRNDYATSDRELTALAARYPGTIEILFYQGVSRLFLNDLPGAIASLTAAEAVADRTFAADVSWYRAVAEQRSGNVTNARARLDPICRAGGADAARACTALDQISKVSDSVVAIERCDPGIACCPRSVSSSWSRYVRTLGPHRSNRFAAHTGERVGRRTAHHRRHAPQRDQRQHRIPYLRARARACDRAVARAAASAGTLRHGACALSPQRSTRPRANTP